MLLSPSLAICFPLLVVAAPFSFPLRNGFPSPSDAELATIQRIAGGTLPNAPPPASVSEDGLINLRLIALNELFEVAFFKELLVNITTNVPGYEIPAGLDREFVISSLKSVKNQEELHALNANGALAHFNAGPIEPCQYNFPVDSFASAIELAATFTDVVLGTLQDVQQVFAINSDVGLVAAVGSVIGQEGEQNGFYRTIQAKKPSSAPFLTAGARDFAFTAIQSFVVPGSCPNIDTIALTTFKPLNILTPKPEAKNSTLQFEVLDTSVTDSMAITYISGKDVPVSVPIKQIVKNGPGVKFEADFPFEQGFSRGLTIAALTKSAGPFTDAESVATATIAGPGLIEID